MAFKPTLTDSAKNLLSALHVEGPSIPKLQTAMVAGEVSSLELVEYYMDRISRLNQRGPWINAILETNPQARGRANELDALRREGVLLGPLHGIPVLLKDCIHTADEMNTTSGSFYLQGLRAKEAATVVQLLRAAGAVVLGKANMDELSAANGLPSGRGGPVRNPYDLRRNASGSSSGLAAAIAAGMAIVGIGADTRSSVRFPAADCSVVALRPTFGLLSRAGCFSPEFSIDMLGPMAANVQDLAILMDVIAAKDASDFATALPDRAETNGFAASLDLRALAGKRIGVPEQGFWGGDVAVDAVVREALEVMRIAGAELVPVQERIPLLPFGGMDENDRFLLLMLRLKYLDRYFSSMDESSTIQSLEQFLFHCVAGQFPSLVPLRQFFRQISPEQIAGMRDLEMASLVEAVERFMSAQRKLVTDIMDTKRLDVLAFPTKRFLATPVIPMDGVSTDGGRGMPELASYSGMPEVSVPAGYADKGLPVGLSLMGRWSRDADLLSMAYAFEQAAGCWKAPVIAEHLPAVPSELPPMPENDLFENRTVLMGSKGMISGNLLRAGLQHLEPTHVQGNLVEASVWYTWAAEGSGTLELSTRMPPQGLQYLCVYTGETLSSLAFVANNESEAMTENDELKPNSLQVEVNTGISYHIAIVPLPTMLFKGDYVLRWELLN